MVNPRRVYVAGAYTANTYEGVKDNIRRAEAIGKHLAIIGHYVYVPHLATAHWEDVQDYKYFSDLHLTFLKTWATDMVLVPGWENSNGTKIEIDFCNRNDIRVFKSIEDFVNSDERCY